MREEERKEIQQNINSSFQHGKIMIMFSDISVILLNFPTMDEYFFHNQETYVVLKKQVR